MPATFTHWWDNLRVTDGGGRYPLREWQARAAWHAALCDTRRPVPMTYRWMREAT